MNAVKSTSVRLEDLYKIESKKMSETSNLPIPRPLLFQNTLTTMEFIDHDPHWFTQRVKEAIHIRLHPKNINRDSGIDILEACMPTIKKHNMRTVRQRTAKGRTH